MPFLRRLAFAPIVLVVVTAVTYGAPRILRADMFAGEAFVPGLARDLDRVFFHLDFGCAVKLRGCPPIYDLWLNGVWWDLWLLAGGTVFGACGGGDGGLLRTGVLRRAVRAVPGFFKYTWRAAGHEKSLRCSP